MKFEFVEKTVYSFIENDEVYKIGFGKEPFGMVHSLGKKFVSVRKHSNGKIVKVNPKELYRGVEWHQHNK